MRPHGRSFIPLVSQLAVILLLTLLAWLAGAPAAPTVQAGASSITTIQIFSSMDDAVSALAGPAVLVAEKSKPEGKKPAAKPGNGPSKGKDKDDDDEEDEEDDEEEDDDDDDKDKAEQPKKKGKD
jgi:hypothetical protein